MKNKISKIIGIIAFLIIILLMLTTSVKATVNIHGKTYYTKDDIHWTGGNNGNWGYIHVDGMGDFYCINHNKILTGYLGNNADLTFEPLNINSEYFDEGTAKAVLEIRKVVRTNEMGWGNGTRTLRLYPQSWVNVNNNNQAALYAFSEHYYNGGSNPSGYVQNAIWEYILKNTASGQNYSNYTHTTLYAGAMYYETWCSINKANLTSDSSNAKARISGSDYIVGPFRVSYNEATYDKIVYSEMLGYTISVPGAQITNSNGTPISTIPNKQDFYVKFPYTEDRASIDMSVSVKYIDNVSGSYQDIKTKSQDFQLEWHDQKLTSWGFQHTITCTSSFRGQWEANASSCTKCSGSSKAKISWKSTPVIKTVGEETEGSYQNMRRIQGQVTFNTATTTLRAQLAPIPKEMDLAGYVWEDVEQGKSQTINGLKDNNDKALAGIEVRLYDITTGRLADVHKGTNPTLTDSNGHYEFKAVNSTHKYYVMFTYDGMLYTNTYGAGAPEYNTDGWRKSSKGSEIVSERDSLNKKFVTISSYPSMYRTTAIFGGSYLTNGYNKIYKINDATVQSYKNAITSALSSALSGRTNYIMSDVEYKQIYINLASNDEAKRILQYIWDSRINSYAGWQSEQDGSTLRAGGKYYPYYDKFALVDVNGNRLSTDVPGVMYNGYPLVYSGQFYINLGLIRRPTTDLELTEDLYKAVVSINGQDETYQYGTFSRKGVKVNEADAMISQNIATDDYDYKVDSTTLSSNLDGTAAYPTNYAPIQMYVTYRINIKNNSATPTSVNEIATYIDSTYYSYSDSYTTTSGAVLKGIEGTYSYPDSDTTVTEKNLTQYDGNSLGLKVNTSSRYGTASETGKFAGTDLYITFDREAILEQNQIVAVYITYRLGENSTKDAKFNCTYKSTQAGGDNHAYAILQDLFRNTDNKKLTVYTRAEINAYSTYFKKDFDASATRSKYASYYTYTSPLHSGATYRAAGVLDALSMPGNLTEAEINNKTEDDWDKASGFVIMDAGKRNITGNVWETVDQPANYWTVSGNYPKFNSSYPAEGITVELIEIKDGIEYVRARTKTAGDGSYRFTDYIPGLYTIRFLYGDSAVFDTEQYSKYTTFTLNDNKYKCAYNGEFYQSALANPKTNDNKYWYAVEEGERYSDAYDEVTIRKAVNELLQTYSYSDVVKLLKEPTNYMVYAYTSLLDIEVEKATESTVAQNPSYTISNIDFALTPRTESKLSINKEVTHLKLILQNGAVQFDTDTQTIREQGVPAVVQAAQGYDVNISMSSELINGATLEITYTVTVTNEGAEDTVTYYKDASGNIIALGLYKENPSKIVYYEDTMRTHNNIGGFQRNTDTTWVSKTTTGTTAMRALDANKTQQIETTTRADLVADYVSNNLNFAKVNYNGTPVNEGWDLYTGTKADFETEYYKQNQDTAEQALKPQISKDMDASEIYDSNTIVLANNQNKLVTTNLKSGESVSENIILSKVISVNDNSTDTKSYDNKVRILRINDTTSRVQDMKGPTLTHKSEHVIISDPTGIGNIYLGILLVLAVSAVIAVGIIFIKKFVITKQ